MYISYEITIDKSRMPSIAAPTRKLISTLPALSLEYAHHARIPKVVDRSRVSFSRLPREDKPAQNYNVMSEPSVKG